MGHYLISDNPFFTGHLYIDGDITMFTSQFMHDYPPLRPPSHCSSINHPDIQNHLMPSVKSIPNVC